MSLIEKFNILSKIDPIFVDNLKLIFIPHKEILFVTRDDNVYQYLYGGTPKKLNELCNKRVKKFDCGEAHYMALTEDGHAYSWGANEYGQLGNGTDENDCSQPNWILKDYHVHDISCGRFHTIILTRGGNVYAFGRNIFGRTIEGDSINNTPVLIIINFASKVVESIGCGENHSCALTTDGIVFCWGNKVYPQSGQSNMEKQFEPIKINVPAIKQVCCGPSYTLLLSENGEIYLCDEISYEINNITHSNPYKFEFAIHFANIAGSMHTDLCVAISIGGECFIIEPKYRGLRQSDASSINDAFAKYGQITYKTIRNVEDLSVGNIAAPFLPYKYTMSFTEIRGVLGTGGFATVFKCEQKNKYYAVKKICIKPNKIESIAKELEILMKLQSKFVVTLIDTWIEENYYIGAYKSNNSQNLSSSNNLYDPYATYLLHIQMEFCSLTFRDAINLIMNDVNCKSINNILSLIGYYISSELMVEVLECVHYLHTQNPPIMHRDLKPENMLLTNFVNNRFVKLSDFGLSTFYDYMGQFHTGHVGTSPYIAPEVQHIMTATETKAKSKYTTKADIYSLGVIWKELFDIDINYGNFDFEPLNEIKSLIVDSMNVITASRPECADMLSKKENWCLTRDQLTANNSFMNIVNKSPKSHSIDQNFIEFFIQKKFALH